MKRDMKPYISIIILTLIIIVISGCMHTTTKTEISPQQTKEIATAPSPTPTPSYIKSEQKEQYKESKEHYNPDDSFRMPTIQVDMPSCGDAKNIFTMFPLNMADFTEVTPLGLLSPTAHVIPTRHIYLRIRREGDVSVGVPLYAPSDMQIVKMSSVDDVSASPKFGADYAMWFYPCKEFGSYFDHVSSLSPKIKEAFDNSEAEFCEKYTLNYPAPVDWKFCRKNVNIKINKGELIGMAGGAEGQNLLDFAAFDFRIIPHVFVNQNRWSMHGNLGNEMLYVVCALDYFPDNISKQAKAKLKRKIEPLCGEVAQDIPGTAQGNWVPLGQNPTRLDEKTAIALVHDNEDPTIPVFSIGNSVKTLPFGKYKFSPQNQGLINRDFKDVKEGQIYCYEVYDEYNSKDHSGIILIQLINPTTLKIEAQSYGSCGSSLTFNSPTEFER